MLKQKIIANHGKDRQKDDDYSLFSKKVKQTTGIDLSLYKEAQMKRRLRSFFKKKNFTSFDEFFMEGINKDKNVLHEFLDRMTINVSEFYRNPKRWNILMDVILPQLSIKRDRLKVWSAACSSGEEAYTISMILKEKYSDSKYSILATDIDEAMLSRAKAGIYTEQSIKELSEKMKERYFIDEQPDLRVVHSLKDNISFRKHNLLADTYKTDFDLIICRNVLIYFTEEAKSSIYKKFNQALRLGGIIFIGSTEQIFNPIQYGFKTEETCFYKKVKNVT